MAFYKYKFVKISRAGYTKLQNTVDANGKTAVDANAFYYVYDPSNPNTNGDIYKGNIILSNSVVTVSDVNVIPTADNKREDVFYVDTKGGIAAFLGNKYVIFANPNVRPVNYVDDASVEPKGAVSGVLYFDGVNLGTLQGAKYVNMMNMTVNTINVVDDASVVPAKLDANRFYIDQNGGLSAAIPTNKPGEKEVLTYVQLINGKYKEAVILLDDVSTAPADSKLYHMYGDAQGYMAYKGKIVDKNGKATYPWLPVKVKNADNATSLDGKAAKDYASTEALDALQKEVDGLPNMTELAPIVAEFDAKTKTFKHAVNADKLGGNSADYYVSNSVFVGWLDNVQRQWDAINKIPGSITLACENLHNTIKAEYDPEIQELHDYVDSSLTGIVWDKGVINIADLKAIKAPKNATAVFVSNKGASYRFDASNTATSDSSDETVVIAGDKTKGAWVVLNTFDVSVASKDADGLMAKADKVKLDAFGDPKAYAKTADCDKAYVAKEDGKGLSTNDFTKAYKDQLDDIDITLYETKNEAVEALDKKVDKVAGKALSDNNYDNASKAIVDGIVNNYAGKDIEDKVAALEDHFDDKGIAKQAAKLTDFDPTAYTKTDDMNAALAKKVDTVKGKGLSTNDYDAVAKAAVDGLSDTYAPKGVSDDVAILKGYFDAEGKGVANEAAKLTGFTPADYVKSDDAADTYVAKVKGKGLSTNDYDNTAKAAVDGLADNYAGKAMEDKVAALEDHFDARGVAKEASKLTNFDPSKVVTTDDIDEAVANKVDKVKGKGLSTNDYDDNAKAAVDGMAKTYAVKGTETRVTSLENIVTTVAGKFDADGKVAHAVLADKATEFADPSLYAKAADVKASLAKKVDAVDGKGLSTNDYTDDDKSAVDNISTAELEVDKIAGYFDKDGKAKAAVTADKLTDDSMYVKSADLDDKYASKATEKEVTALEGYFDEDGKVKAAATADKLADDSAYLKATALDDLALSYDSNKKVITLTLNGKSATVSLTAAPPTKVTATPTTLTMNAATEAGIVINVEPTDSADQNVTATSSDESVVTLKKAPDGVNYIATAIKGGTATLTFAAQADATKKATVAVDVSTPMPTKVVATPTTTSMIVGDETGVTINVEPAGAIQTVDASSSDDGVVAVKKAPDGINYFVTAVGAGTATLTFASTTDKNKKATVDFTVARPAVDKITIDPATLTGTVGGSSKITVKVTPDGADASLHTATSDASVATISWKEGEGYSVNFLKKGTATITLTAMHDQTKKCDLPVTVNTPAPTSVIVTPTKLSVDVGSEAGITINVEPTTADQTVDGKSSDETIATLKKAQDGINYIVTGVKAGTTTLTFASHEDDTKKATVDLTVAPSAPTSVILTPTDLSVDAGSEAGITVNVKPDTADQATDAKSSDETIVTVKKAQDGVNYIATGVKAGTAKISVASHADATKTSDVNITVTVPKPNKVIATPTDLTLDAGTEAGITINVDPATADQTVDAKSSDETIVTVKKAQDGINYIATGVKDGTAKITFASHADATKTADVAVTVTIPKPTKITATPTTTALAVGDETGVTITIDPPAADQAVDASTSDDKVITIKKAQDLINYFITAVGVGKATATFVSHGDKNMKATVDFTVGAPAPTKVDVDNATLSLLMGKTGNVVASVEPAAADQTVDATSSDDKTATVKLADDKKSFVVTPVKAGTAKITFASHVDNTKKTDVDVTIIDAPTKVDVDPATLSILMGKTGSFTVKVEPDSANQAVDVTSADDKTATVKLSDDKKSYVVTPVKVGTVKINAAAHDDATKTAAVDVTIADAPTKVDVDPATLAVDVGATGSFTVKVEPDTANQAVDVTSSDDKTATVKLSDDKKSYVVTGVKAGTATVTAAAHDDATKKSDVTITVNTPVPAATKVDVDPATLSITEGQTGSFTVKIEPDGADQTADVSSSDDKTATVKLADDKKSYVVTAVKAGTAKIAVAAHSNSKIAGEVDVTVAAPAPAATKVDVTPATLSVLEGQTGSFTVKVEPDGADQAVDVATSDDKTATVALSDDKKSYVVTAIKAGTAKIAVTAHSNNKIAAEEDVTVTAPPAATKVDVDNATLSIGIGKTGTFKATVEPDGADQTVDVASSDDKTATVALSDDKKSFVVTAVKAGTAKIAVTAHSNNKIAAEVDVTAVVIPTKVSLDPTSVSVGVGKTVTASVKVEPADADQTLDIAYADEDIATELMSDDGKTCSITGVKVGTGKYTFAAHTDKSITTDLAITVTK